MISEKGHYYLQQSELDHCFIINNCAICQNEWFHYSREVSCEYDLLKNGNRSNYKDCDILYKHQKATSFFKTIVGHQWVFTTFGKIEIIINCGIQYVRSIQGTGIIKFNPRCKIEYERNILTTEK